MRHTSIRWILLFLGWVAAGLGIAGLFLPILPTTPFILLAAFLFERSSERLHRQLVEHPRLGPFIRDWNEHRIIRPKTKFVSIVLLWALISYPVFFREYLSTFPKVVMILIACSVTVFLLTTKSR